MSKAQIISVFLFGSPLLFPEETNDLFFHDDISRVPRVNAEFSLGLTRRNSLKTIWIFIPIICSIKRWRCWNCSPSLCIFMGFSSFCNKRFNTI